MPLQLLQISSFTLDKEPLPITTHGTNVYWDLSSTVMSRAI